MITEVWNSAVGDEITLKNDTEDCHCIRKSKSSSKRTIVFLVNRRYSKVLSTTVKISLMLMFLIFKMGNDYSLMKIWRLHVAINWHITDCWVFSTPHTLPMELNIYVYTHVITSRKFKSKQTWRLTKAIAEMKLDTKQTMKLE